MLVERPRVIHVGRAQGDVVLALEGRAIDGQAAVAALVGRETLEEQAVGRDRDHRVARNEQSPELGIVLHQVTGIRLTRLPVCGPRSLVSPFQLGRVRLGQLGEGLVDRDPSLLRGDPAQLVLATFLLGLVGFICAFVARPVPEVADDDVVQRADGLAEVERVAEDAFEADAVAPAGWEPARRPLRPGSRSPRCGRDRRGSLAWGGLTSRRPSSAGGIRRFRVATIRGAGGPVSTSRRRPRSFTEAPASTPGARDTVDSARAPGVLLGPKRTTALGKHSPGQVRPRRIAAA